MLNELEVPSIGASEARLQVLGLRALIAEAKECGEPDIYVEYLLPEVVTSLKELNYGVVRYELKDGSLFCINLNKG